MYTLTLTNKDNKKLEFNGLNAAYNITNIQGLAPNKATINTVQAALIDGGLYNSAKLDMRTINMAFTIEEPVEKNRLAAYQVLRIKEPITINYISPNIEVYIEGYIASIDVGHFDIKQKMTVSILCPKPYWLSAQQMITELSTTASMFHFPFYNLVEHTDIVFGLLSSEAKAVVPNGGGIETGIIFEILASDACSGIKIFDYITQDFIGVDFEMEAGDLITINTRQGEKSITLTRHAEVTNIFNNLMKDSTWLQLAAAGSVYVYTLESGSPDSVEVLIKHNDLYEGV